MQVTGLNDYQKKAIQTYTDKGVNRGILIATLGMSQNIAEYLDITDKAKSAKTIGDCLWYTAILMHLCGRDLDDVYMDATVAMRDNMQRYPSAKTAVIVAGENTKAVKTWCVFNSPIDGDYVVERAGLYLLSLDRLAKQMEIPLLQIATQNIKAVSIKYANKNEEEQHA